MSTKKRATVYRVRGLPRGCTDQQLLSALRPHLDEDEKEAFRPKISIIPSCYDDDDTVAALLKVENAPRFLDELSLDPLKDWQVEVDLPDTDDINIDRHFHGFTQLYPTPDGQSITVDIIAITGLDGHAFGSWQGKGNLGRMWLLDFLSKDLPRCRTMIYGYNSKLQSRGLNTILDYVADFLEQVKRVRCTPEEIQRPLILIGHSFGGLVAAQTLVKAKQADEDENPTISSLYKAIYAMMFFGTPHKGLMIDDIQSMLGEDPSHPRAVLVNEIKQQSQRLSDQLCDFKNLIRDRKIVSFVEMQQTRRLHKSSTGSWNRSGAFITAVDPSAAFLQLPDSLEIKVRVDADHSHIVKFDSRQDRTYQNALKYLKDFEMSAGPVVNRRFHVAVENASASNPSQPVPPLHTPLSKAGNIKAGLPIHAVSRSGFTVLYQPKNADPLVDVVFVHGVGGHPWETWAFDCAETSESTACTAFWPSDVLPTDCPDVRVMTWGYNADLSDEGHVPERLFSANARLFLNQLDRLRPLGRGIVLVAHSLGGILIKEALRLSEDDSKPRIKDIVNSVIGVIFLGTPHRGNMDEITLEEAIIQAACLILRLEVGSARVQSLDMEASEILRSRESFMRLWKMYDFRVKTFHEAYDSDCSKSGISNRMVVPKFSASFDDPREKAEVILANHTSMSKFTGSDDPNYHKLKTEIQTAARSVKKRQEALRSGCCQSLYFPEHQHREDSIDPALERTCQWLFDTRTYQDWEKWETSPEGKTGLLWLKGKPGSGKSTLMKEALRRAKDRTASDSIAVVGFFFSARGNVELQKTPLGLLRTVLHELLQQDDALLSAFLPVFRQKQNRVAGTWYWYQDELQAVLQSAYATNTFSVKKTFIFIDALDECSDGNLDVVRNLVYFLRPLTMDSRLKICLSSRHYPHIKVPDCPEIVLERHNHQDIIHYVDSRLSPWGSDRRAHSLADRIAQKAEGVFLWVVLVVKRLNMVLDNEGTEEDLEESLRTVPKKLEDLFESLFSDLDSQTERQRAVSVVQWVLLAERPLNADEMRHAVGFSQNYSFASIKAWEKSGTAMPEEPMRCLISLRGCTRGLVEIKTHPKHQHSKDPSPRWSNLDAPALLPPLRGVPAKHPIFTESLGKDRPPERQYGSEAPQDQLPKKVRQESSLERQHSSKAPQDRPPKKVRRESSPERQYGSKASQARLPKKARRESSPPWRFGTETLRAYDTPALLSYEIPAPPSYKTPALRPYDTPTLPSYITNAPRAYETPALRLYDTPVLRPYDTPTLPSYITNATRGYETPALRLTDTPALPSYISNALRAYETLAPPPYIANTPRAYENPTKLPGGVEYIDSRFCPIKSSSPVPPPPPVQFIHESVREFFLFGKGFDILDRSTFLKTIADRHCSLMETCIRYLSIDEMSQLAIESKVLFLNNHLKCQFANRLDDFPFLPYSVNFLFHHALEAERLGKLPQMLVDSLQGEESQLWKRWVILKHQLDKDGVHAKNHTQYTMQSDRALTPGYTAFHHLCESNLQMCASALIDRGTDLNSKDDKGYTALHFAIEDGNVGLVHFLVSRGADVHARDKSGAAPLHKSAHHGLRHSTLRELLQPLLCNKECLDDRDERGLTPLHTAVNSSQEDLVRILLSHGANIHAQDADGNTPLHLASHINSKSILLQLVKAGARPDDKNGLGETSLHNAARLRDPQCAIYLLQAGADLDAKDNALCTPLHLRAASGFGLRRFINSGADVNETTASGKTALDLASELAHWEPVLDLLGSGATAYTGGAARITPLHHAAGRGINSIVTRWLQAGADVAARTSTGETPLHFAARNGNLACVKTLVNAGSGLSVKDAKGRTPLDHATHVLSTNYDYIRFMESKGCRRVLRMVGSTLRRILEPPP